MSPRKKIFKNIAISGMYTYLNQGVNLISMVILARLLYPSDYGIFALIQVFSAFIAILQDNGIIQAVIRGESKDVRNLEKLHSLSLLIGIFCSILMWGLTIPMAYFYENNSLILPSLILGFSFFLNSFLTVPTAALQQELNFRLIGKIQLLSNTLAFLCCGFAAYSGLSYWSLLIREFAFTAIQLIIILNVKRINIIFNFNEVKSSFFQVKQIMYAITGFGVINFFSRNTDNLLIGKFYGEEKLGIYNRAYSLIYLSINLISGIINQVLFPSLVDKDISKIRSEYKLSTNIVSSLLFPLMLLFNIFPNAITLFIWGEKWVEVAALLPYIGILIFSQCQLFLFGNILVLCKKEKYLIPMALINTTITVTGIILGIFFSFFYVIKMYTLFYISLSVPIAVYIIYYTVLQDTLYTVYKFWIPKILIMWGAYFLTLGEQRNNYWAWILFSCIFYLHLFIEEKHLIISFAGKLKNKKQV